MRKADSFPASRVASGACSAALEMLRADSVPAVNKAGSREGNRAHGKPGSGVACPEWAAASTEASKAVSAADLAADSEIPVERARRPN